MAQRSANPSAKQLARRARQTEPVGPRIYDLAAVESLLGKASDTEIAAKLGCSRSTVQRQRAELEIGPSRHERRYSDKDDALIRSKSPVKEIADKLGVSPRAVALRRQWLKSRR